MTAVLDPIETLDDEQQRTPTWEQYRKQRGENADERKTCPRGTYEATLVEAALVRRKDGGGFVIRMVARTTGLGVFLVSWRGLSADEFDPYKLTDSQVKSLRKFAESMGIPTPAPAQQIVNALFDMHGATVEATVRHTPAGVQTSLSRPGVAPSASLVEGEVLSLQGAADVAHQAHQQVLTGLRRTREGLIQTAAGCHALASQEGWSALGYDSLAEYLAAPEITLSRSEFYRLADIYETYVLKGEVDPAVLTGAGESKLEVPLPAIKQGLVSADVAASDAEALTRKELRDRYREMMGGELVTDPEPEPVAPTLTVTPVDESPAGGTGEAGHQTALQAQLEERADEIAELRTELEAVREQVSHQQPQTDLSHMTLAQGLALTLARVLREIGAPEQKRMGKDLRAAVVAALDSAREHGLDVE